MSMTEQSLGQLARKIPGATRVFHDYQLDFCCGGKQTLGEAAQAAGLDAQAIEASLLSLQAQAQRDGRDRKSVV